MRPWNGTLTDSPFGRQIETTLRTLLVCSKFRLWNSLHYHGPLFLYQDFISSNCWFRWISCSYSDKILNENVSNEETYEELARDLVISAMEGINGMFFSICVLLSICSFRHNFTVKFCFEECRNNFSEFLKNTKNSTQNLITSFLTQRLYLRTDKPPLVRHTQWWGARKIRELYHEQCLIYFVIVQWVIFSCNTCIII